MSGLRLLVLGVGDAFSARYYSSCLALEAEGSWLLVDCPHPIRKILHEGGTAAGIDLDVTNISAVALTHLHADHCSGLEGLGFYSYFYLNRPVQLLVHPEVSARLWEGCLAAGMEWTMPGDSRVRGYLHDYFHLIPLSEADRVTFGPFTIQCRPTIHTIPTMAMLIWAGGRCFGYSSDTAYDDGLIDWLSQADLIVHETNLGIHTPYEKLASLPEALRAKMRLIHYPDEFDSQASIIEPLRQGQCFGVAGS
ncbi:MAG: ribonuclease Z [Planctomycetes bacterium]|nr:ribonuclease Z [Planctomycetota bacterium]